MVERLLAKEKVAGSSPVRRSIILSMCGIFGFVSKYPKPSSEIIDGIKTLEYRGYDSWGAVVISKNGKLKRERHVGKIGDAKTTLPPTKNGMGHTRWATHGGVTVKNAHPHIDCNERFAVIHNGIIENEKELRKDLLKKTHKLTSETDTELITHLLEETAKTNKKTDLVSITSKVVGKLEGAFAIGVIDRENPGELVIARLGGPLVIGLNESCNYFASDPYALLPHTKNVIYLKDHELALITADGVEVRHFNQKKKPLDVTELDWDVEKADKGGFEHFMLKEIMEQPDSIKDSLRGRVDQRGEVKLGGLETIKSRLRDTDFIRFIASGTASYAGLYGALITQALSGVTSVMEPASEFNYTEINWPEKSAAWFISQSGETADLLNSIKKVDKEKILKLGLVNVVGSSVARRTDAGVYLHAGPEVAVASTKAFTSQLTCLALIACWLSQNQKKTSSSKRKESFLVGKELLDLPGEVEKVLNKRKEIKKLAKKIKDMQMVSFFGRGVCYPLALEGALKLKEISYLDAIGMPSGDLKHGPIAAMDEKRPAIFLASSDDTLDKNYSSIKELRARNIPTFVVTDKVGKKELKDVSDQLIEIPVTHSLLQPILFAVVVQLLAYEAALLRGCTIDKPRNLAKSVTVE